MRTEQKTSLAYDVAGAGTAVVFLHGLTFDRRVWRPIVERLGESVRSIAVDLPAHGQSGGAPARLDEVAGEVHELLESLAVERPVLVGHSMSAGLAFVYASAYPTRGLVVIDQGPEVRPFAELLHRIAPALRGPNFADVWSSFEDSLGIGRIPEPMRSLVRDAHHVDQDVVLGYWDQPLREDPAELQRWIDEQVREIVVPCLAVFGRPLTDGERERFEGLPDFQLEQWVGEGHFVHLVDPDRFTARLRTFLAHCTTAGSQPEQVEQP